MDRARFVAAMISIVLFPPSLIYWVIIHSLQEYGEKSVWHPAMPFFYPSSYAWLLESIIAPYLLLLIWFPLLYLVTVLEEKELVDRFGEEYREYQRKLPRFVPRHFLIKK